MDFMVIFSDSVAMLRQNDFDAFKNSSSFSRDVVSACLLCSLLTDYLVLVFGTMKKSL